MALKYTIEYPDISDITHKLEIYDDDFSGSNTDIDGAVFFDFSETDDVLNPIKGSGLRVELEANSALTFSDLYSEYEKDFKVIYYRNSVIKFQGWINPEGWYEDFVQDKWQVTFDCIDGLSFLENLSYVDANGLNFVTQQTALEVIAACLLKTGLEQDIKVDIGVVYSGLTETLDILDNLTIDPIRYVKDDDNTVMSCKEVLESILDLLTASIVSMDGTWFIYRPNQLAESETFGFHHYDFEGTPESPTTGTKDLLFELGSEINSFFPHHCSANQSIANEKSIGAYRINYKYGIKKGLLENIFLTSNGLVIDEWTIDVATGTNIPASNFGFEITAVTPAIAFSRHLYSDNMALGLDDLVDMRFVFSHDVQQQSGGDPEQFRYKLICVGTTTYYYNGSSWTTTDTTAAIDLYHNQSALTILEQLTIPIDGDLRLEFWTPKHNTLTEKEYTVLIQEVIFTAVEEQEDDLEGEIHTFQRATKPNSKIKDTKEVFNGDNDSSIYVGALFQANGTSLTELWKRKGVTESVSILRLMGNETMRLKQETRKVFSGSVFGYFDFLSVVTIDGFDDGAEPTPNSYIFLVTKWSYNTQSNIVSAEFKQVFEAELTDIDYTNIEDRGNVVKPTIRG